MSLFRNLLMKQNIYNRSYLTFTATQNQSSVKLQQNGFPYSISLYYNKNCTGWNSYTVGDVISLTNIGDTVSFKGITTTFSQSDSNYYHFLMSGEISASGNINSLINYYSLTPYCYIHLFYACNSLITAPELPATTLSNHCYYLMFAFCQNLTTVSELPATNLSESCYGFMFRNCTNLSSITVNFLDWNSLNDSTDNWLQDVASSGTFICPSILGTNDTIARGINYCPESWSVINK